MSSLPSPADPWPTTSANKARGVVRLRLAVDDASTKELMTDFYTRLLAGETDKLAAFTAAKKALRAKYPDPFHWAPFLYIGSP